MSNLQETPKMTGMVTLEHFNEAGELIEKKTVKNLVVDAGLTWMAARMTTLGIPDQMSHMGIGSGQTAAAAGNTDLGGLLGSRQPLTVAGGSPSGATVTYVATFGAGIATGDVYEAGIFNASTAGTMLCRTVFGLITKAAGDSLAVTWVITAAG